MNFRVGQKVWAPIRGFEGLYEVSSGGEVKSIRSGNILKGSPIPGGYLTVALHKDGKQTTKSIHRLVCEAFHANPQRKPAVNHIDGSKTNNSADNLEWVTPAENTAHGVAMGLIKGVPRKISGDARLAVCDAYQHDLISLKDVGRKFGVSKGTVKLVLIEENIPIRRHGPLYRLGADRFPCGKIRPSKEGVETAS